MTGEILSLALTHTHTHISKTFHIEPHKDLYLIYTQLLTDPNWILGRERGWWWRALSSGLISLGHWPPLGSWSDLWCHYVVKSRRLMDNVSFVQKMLMPLTFFFLKIASIFLSLARSPARPQVDFRAVWEKNVKSWFSVLFWAWNWESSVEVWGCESTFCGLNEHVSMREGLFSRASRGTRFSLICWCCNSLQMYGVKSQTEMSEADLTLNLGKGYSFVHSGGLKANDTTH